ncbi:MAG: hypothetical protein E7286_08945 [Lachnospiraceae bacterium]|nr:hypothetical protein [Lachnospiraceae bacterium]
MSSFKLTWRLIPGLWLDDAKWLDFMNLISKYDDVADEVAFFFSDDTFLDCTPLEDTQRQADVFQKRAAMVRALGGKVGVNVWPTFDLYQNRQKYYAHMPRMVTKDGNVINELACPSSEMFRAYIREKYLIMAKAAPDFIYVDDDCRFTHMVGGGYPCFCDTCVKNFENGRFQSREELVESLNQKENRDLRIRWSAYGADRLADFCKVVRAAVDEVDPAIDMPFMSVGTSHTTYSGDYIAKCTKALRSRRGRPGLFFFDDRIPDKMIWKTMEVGRQVTEYADTVEDLLWEEDSHPQTHLNKSMRARQNEVTLALMAGCTGVAFNHQNANPKADARLGREVEELHAMRPLWEKFFSFSRGLDWAGMWSVHDWFLTAKMDCEKGWFDELSYGLYNINTYGSCPSADYDVTVPDKIGTSGVALTADKRYACATLLYGKTLHSFSEEELQKVFSGNVIMDKTALRELEKLGHGDWAGVKLNENVGGGTPYATAHPFNGPFENWSQLTTLSGMTSAALIPLDDTVEKLAEVRNGLQIDSDNAAISPEATDTYMCISKYENAMGGKIIVDSYDPWHYCDEAHRLYLYSSIAEWFGAPLRMCWPDPCRISRIQPYIRTNGSKAAILLVNASLDTSYETEILVRGTMTKAVLVHKDGSETSLSCHREGEQLCIRIPPIGGWEIACVHTF